MPVTNFRKCFAALGFSLLAIASSFAGDLGIEGQVYEPIEEDFRIMMIKLIARQDWTAAQDELSESAHNYTKSLPAYYLPRAETTKTTWKDVGIITSEDIYLPWVDYEKGSVFEPEQILAVPAGTYLNPLTGITSAGIERLFVFDATDPDQLATAKELIKDKIPQLSFMAIAGDIGELSKEVNQPIYHPSPGFLEKFVVTAVPSLIGFGLGTHNGHMAVTQFKLPVTIHDVKNAWSGLAYKGYDPYVVGNPTRSGE